MDKYLQKREKLFEKKNIVDLREEISRTRNNRKKEVRGYCLYSR